MDLTPETCQNIEKMLILNSRYREIVIVEILILLSSYRGSIAIQGNYPKKCCHSALVGLLTSSFSPGAHCPSLGGWGGIKTFRVFMLFTADPTVGRGRGMAWVWNASLRGIFWIYVDSTRGQGSLPVLRTTKSVLALPSLPLRCLSFC